ncbi:MAG: thiamine phosphate synthase [Vicinamibacterales bacterium]
MSVPPLYPIIDVDLCRMRGMDPSTLAGAYLDGGARLIQLRQKSGGSRALLDLTRKIIAAAAPYGARIILNDRVDLALIAGAHGVHVGQSDLTPAAAKAMTGRGLIVGQSTHTPAQVDDALNGPADYIAVGPVFQTRTKDTGYEPRGLGLVRLAAHRGKPVIAIGGISLDNAAEVIAAGASAVAVISDLLTGGHPAQRVREYLRVCA